MNERLLIPDPEKLSRYGWDATWNEKWALSTAMEENEAGLEPARVLSENRGHWTVGTAGGARRAELTGKLRFAAVSALDRPAVGDWVRLRPGGPDDPALIEGVLERRSLLTRKAPGETSREQILAANVDYAFVVSSMNADLNPRRIERYLAVVWNGGAEPVVVLTKADLRSEKERAEDHERLAEIALGARVIEASGFTGHGVDGIRELLAPGRTGVLIGSSGVGKSTLTNALLNASVQTVRDIREDDAKGRHTTTGRELFELPGGGCLIDTPGMRELGVMADGDDGIAHGFPEIEALLGRCRFTDCAHETEPGCVIRAALETGEVSAERLASYRKLEREAAFQARKGDKAAESRERKQWKRITVQARSQMKRKRGEG